MLLTADVCAYRASVDDKTVAHHSQTGYRNTARRLAGLLASRNRRRQISAVAVAAALNEEEAS